MVSVHFFYSENSSLNPTEAYIFSCKTLLDINKNVQEKKPERNRTKIVLVV